eukprot:1154636-Pelagomonas_calceolata.AAC.1
MDCSTLRTICGKGSWAAAPCSVRDEPAALVGMLAWPLRVLLRLDLTEPLLRAEASAMLCCPAPMLRAPAAAPQLLLLLLLPLALPLPTASVALAIPAVLAVRPVLLAPPGPCTLYPSTAKTHMRELRVWGRREGLCEGDQASQSCGPGMHAAARMSSGCSLARAWEAPVRQSNE